MKKLLLLPLLAVVLIGCPTTKMANTYNPNSKGYHVKVFTPDGKNPEFDCMQFYSQEGSDGWYFIDEATKKLVYVSGTSVITER